MLQTLNKNLFDLALRDLIEGIQSWRIWLLLGWQDIRLRYRRSVIGPFWITLSMAIMIYSMGFLYGKLFKMDLSTYYPFLAAGLISWTLIANVINEGSEAFFASRNFILEIKLPYSIYVLRVITRNIIIFLHNLVALVPILIFYKMPFDLVNFFVFWLNLILIFITGFIFAYLFAILGTRFQDVKQVIISFIQIFFLLTPVLWMPSMLPERFSFFAEYNPFYQVINLLREPLTGTIPSLFTYIYFFAFTTIGALCLIILLWRSRHRIAFWV